MMDLFFFKVDSDYKATFTYINHIHFIVNRVVKRVVGFDAFPTGRFLLTRIVEDKEYLVDDDGVIRSVENLRQLQNVKWVVLSLGGNAPWEAEKGMGKNQMEGPVGCGGMVQRYCAPVEVTWRGWQGIVHFFVRVALLLWKWRGQMFLIWKDMIRLCT